MSLKFGFAHPELPMRQDVPLPSQDNLQGGAS